jgi:hypothetical protein
MKSKAETFIGFILRSGKYRLGVNAIKTVKSVFLLVLCHTASENTKKDAQKLARKLRAKLIISNKFTIEELTNKEHCKLMAVTDKALSTALIGSLDENFTDYSTEESNG